MTYEITKTNVIPQVTEVRFYEDTVEKVKDGHPEVPILLPSMYEAVGNAIENPTSVEKSYGESYVFVDGGTTNASGDPLRVPVQIVEGTSARVRTVLFAEADDEGVIWRRE